MSRFEIEVGSSGLRLNVPLQFDYGVPGRWELLIEPMVSAAANPTWGRWASDARRISSAGNLRAFFATLFLDERRHFPSISVSTWGRVSTGNDFPFSAGHGDGSGELIAFKQVGAVGARGRVEYTAKGELPGGRLELTRNRVNYTVGVEYRQQDRYELLGEVSATQSLLDHAIGELERRPVPRLAGTIGGGYFVHPKSFVHMSVTYRSDGTYSMQPGATFSF